MRMRLVPDVLEWKSSWQTSAYFLEHWIIKKIKPVYRRAKAEETYLKLSACLAYQKKKFSLRVRACFQIHKIETLWVNLVLITRWKEVWSHLFVRYISQNPTKDCSQLKTTIFVTLLPNYSKSMIKWLRSCNLSTCQEISLWQRQTYLIPKDRNADRSKSHLSKMEKCQSLKDIRNLLTTS